MTKAGLGMLAVRDGACNPVARSGIVQRRILLLRHAEKPGDKNDPHLSPRGKARAKLLASWLHEMAKPDFLIAARSRKGSARPRDTLAPLARKMGKRINASFDDKRPRGLAKMLRKDRRFGGRTIVVAWRHKTLPALARLLGANRVPAKWPENRYSWIWDLTLSPRGRVTFRIRRQPALRTG